MIQIDPCYAAIAMNILVSTGGTLNQSFVFFVGLWKHADATIIDYDEAFVGIRTGQDDATPLDLWVIFDRDPRLLCNPGL